MVGTLFSHGTCRKHYVRDMNNKVNEPYKMQGDNYVIRGARCVFLSGKSTFDKQNILGQAHTLQK